MAARASWVDLSAGRNSVKAAVLLCPCQQLIVRGTADGTKFTQLSQRLTINAGLLPTIVEQGDLQVSQRDGWRELNELTHQQLSSPLALRIPPGPLGSEVACTAVPWSCR